MAEHKYDFSSTQINLPKSIGSVISAMAAKIPDADLSDDGREDEPHVTVKYGLHTNRAADVRELLSDEPPIRVRFGKTSLFLADECKKDYDVVKVSVESDDLHHLNKKISGALKVTDTHPTYKPHATIAYVKAGRGKKYDGLDDLDGREVTVNTVHFSDRDGNKHPITLNGDAVEGAIRRSITKD